MGDIENDEAWLHIYPQYRYHSPARIEGSRLALRNLRDAIDRVLSDGMSGTACAMAADGEGYGVEVHIRNLKHLNSASLPYLCTDCNGIGTQEHESTLEREADLEATMQAHRAALKDSASST